MFVSVVIDPGGRESASHLAEVLTANGFERVQHACWESVTINDEGNYEHSSCTCGFHNSMEPCGHVWQLAKYVMDNNLEAPYEYEKDEVREETIEKYFEKRSKIIQETINNEWFKEILKEDIIDKLSKIETSSLNLVPSIEFDELHSSKNFPQIKFKIGRDKLYTIRDIYSQIIIAIKDKEFKNFGKELKVSMYYNAFTDFSKKQFLCSKISQFYEICRSYTKGAWV